NIKFIIYTLRNINIYSATVPDRMHHLDLGLFVYQITFTREILKSQHNNGNILVDKIDRRLAAIPRFPDLKIFSNGLQSIARLTARSEEHTSELQSLRHLVCRLLLEKKKKKTKITI